MKIIGLWNHDRTRHMTIPVKNIRYCECFGGKYLVKYLGRRMKLRVTKQTYLEVVGVMEK